MCQTRTAHLKHYNQVLKEELFDESFCKGNFNKHIVTGTPKQHADR